MASRQGETWYRHSQCRAGEAFHTYHIAGVDLALPVAQGSGFILVHTGPGLSRHLVRPEFKCHSLSLGCVRERQISCANFVRPETICNKHDSENSTSVVVDRKNMSRLEI